jgi:hypothetical protein
MMPLRAWILGLILVGGTGAVGRAAEDPMTMRVSPMQSLAPAHLTVQVHVQPSTENRSLEIVIDSVDFYRSSLVPLEGDRAPRIFTVDFRSLPIGDYEVRGVLLDSVGHSRAAVRLQARVVS